MATIIRYTIPLYYEGHGPRLPRQLARIAAVLQLLADRLDVNVDQVDGAVRETRPAQARDRLRLRLQDLHILGDDRARTPLQQRPGPGGPHPVMKGHVGVDRRHRSTEGRTGRHRLRRDEEMLRGAEAILDGGDVRHDEAVDVLDGAALRIEKPGERAAVHLVLIADGDRSLLPSDGRGDGLLPRRPEGDRVDVRGMRHVDEILRAVRNAVTHRVRQAHAPVAPIIDHRKGERLVRLLGGLREPDVDVSLLLAYLVGARATFPDRPC